MSRAQSMSFDAVAATFLFILVAVFGVIYAFNYFSGDVTQTLRNEASVISEYLIDDLSVQSASGETVIDEDRFVEYIVRNQGEYSTLKSEFGVIKDFCVFLEDQDGMIVIIVRSDGVGGTEVRRAAFGSEEVLFLNSSNPVPCG